MSRHPYYEPGSWNAVCSMCGRDFKSSELVKHWQGMYRCQSCWEPRHPQDYVRGVPPNSAPSFIQAPGPNVFAPGCTPNGASAIPGFAVPGCAIPGYIHPFFDPNVSDEP